MTKLETLRAELKNLSEAELESLLGAISEMLKQKKQPDVPPDEQSLLHLIPGAYRLSQGEVERHLRAVFTEEELEEAKKVNLADLPPLPKPMWEYISEDREDIRLPQLLELPEQEEKS
jgi:hypothetical protein